MKPHGAAGGFAVSPTDWDQHGSTKFHSVSNTRPLPGVMNSELENYVKEFALPEFHLALKVVNQAFQGESDGPCMATFSFSGSVHGHSSRQGALTEWAQGWHRQNDIKLERS